MKKLILLTLALLAEDMPPPLHVHARKVPFFELAPLSGQGMTDVCAEPNWLLYSQTFANAAWTKQGITASAPTVTDSYNGVTGETRLQFAATSGPAESSDAFQAPSAFPGGILATGLEVKGTSESGTIDVCRFSGTWACTSCAFTASDFIECAAPSGTATSGSAYLQIGNVTYHNGGTLRVAADVIVRKARMHRGSSLGPYFATTTAAMAPQPTGSKGETVTTVRPSVANCSKAANAKATTEIPDDSIVLMPANAIRVEYDYQGVKGVHEEEARSNYDLRSEEINNAWWSNANTGTAAPVLNGSCTTTPIKGANFMPQDYTFAATTSGQDNGRLGTVIGALAAVPSTHSYFVCGVTGAGTMDICVWNTTTPTCSTCSFPACSSGKWERCNRTTTSSANVATFIGNSTLYNGGTNRSQNRVCITGAQAEAGSDLTTYMPTSSATATRWLATVDVDLGANAPPANLMSMAVTITGKPASNTDGYPGALNLASDSVGSTSGKGMWLYSPSTYGSTMRCITQNNAGTVYATGSSGASSGNLRAWCASYGDGQTLSGYWNGALTASAAQSGTFSPARYLRLYGQSLGAMNVIKSQISIDHDPTRCR